jgi:hypothetical protein
VPKKTDESKELADFCLNYVTKSLTKLVGGNRYKCLLCYGDGQRRRLFDTKQAVVKHLKNAHYDDDTSRRQQAKVTRVNTIMII